MILVGLPDLSIGWWRYFGPILEDILANAAELDWRGEAVDYPKSVLRTVWRDLLELLPTASNRQRAELVGQLKRAAIFRPPKSSAFANGLSRILTPPMTRCLVTGAWRTRRRD